MAELTGKEALEFFERLKQKHAKQREDDLVREKADAQRRGKEPFDLAKLETMCDTSSEGRLDPLDERRARFEYGYYVEHPSILTLAEYAAHIERASKW